MQAYDKLAGYTDLDLIVGMTETSPKESGPKKFRLFPQGASNCVWPHYGTWNSKPQGLAGALVFYATRVNC